MTENFITQSDERSRRTWLDCAAICDEAAAYQNSLIPQAENRFDEFCIKQARDKFLNDAMEYRSRAA